MAVSIIKTPSEGQTKPMMPAYNGLPFIVYSDKTKRYNYKYIADVYVGGNLVTTLKHNKNISANNYGIFDVGRVVENYLSTRRYDFTTPGFAGDTTCSTDYYIKFGEEYERYLEYTSTLSYGGGFQTRLIVPDGHNLRPGDLVVLQNNTDSSYDFSLGGDIYFRVLITTATSVIIDKPWTNNSSGLIIEGEQFWDNYYYAHPTLGALVGFVTIGALPTRINVGDTVVVSQRKAFVTPAVAGYDGEWLVVDIITVGSNKIIVTNCPWNTSSPPVPGVIYSKDKYKFTEQVTSSTEWSWNGGLQYKEFLSYDIDDFYISSAPSSQGRFLTNGPKTRTIQLGQIEYLSLINWDNSNLYNMRAHFNSYTSSGVLIDAYSTPLFTSTKVYKILQLGVGTENLDGNLDFTNASYYTVQIKDSLSNPISETITYSLDRECYRYPQKRLMWLNRLGGWDFFTFNLRSDVTTNINRNEFKRNLRSYNSTSGLYNYQMGDRGTTTYMVQANDEETVFSNWIKDDEMIWLEELYTSPEVYLIEDTNQFLPINITNESFTKGNKENIGLTSYSITYKHSNDKIIQRG